MRLRSLFPTAALAGLCLVVGALLLAGCGTQGYAAPLPKAASAALTLTGQQVTIGSAKLTPVYATHITTYYPSGTALPYANAPYPAQLRQGSCTGPVLAALTADAPGPQKPMVVRPDAAGGVDVAIPQDASLYVVVLARANDPHAAPIACGNPLSNRRQYFDLYPPALGNNGTGKGIVRMEPIVSTQIAVTLAQPASAPTSWVLRTGGCDGRTLATGTIAPGAKEGSGVVFQSVSTSAWYLTTGTSGQVSSSCGKVSS